MDDATPWQLVVKLGEVFLPDLWRALPAAVLALLAFGFRRMARRFLGLFERIEVVEHKVDLHLEEARLGFQRNEETHKAIIAMVEDHMRRSSEESSRAERAVEAQARRIDELVGTGRKS